MSDGTGRAGPAAPDRAPGRGRFPAVSRAATDLLEDADVVDLHLDAFIPVRLFGYRVLHSHGTGPTGGRLLGHLDVPRMRAGGLTGAMWSITTNPARTAAGRWRAWRRNLLRMRTVVEGSEGRLALATDLAGYRRARARGALAVFLSVQGGNALDAAPDGDPLGDDAVVRVTLVHLTPSRVGGTSSPFQRLVPGPAGLSPQGRRLVERLDARRVFVDLAHLHPRGFWDAVDAHDRRRPLLVTHTGVQGVRRSWRNLDDAQIRAVADTGGVVGVMFHAGFLRRPGGPRDGRMVLEHLEHVVRVGGEGAAALGSDYDGMIVPPRDLRDGGRAYGRLVQAMLERGWPEARIRAVLGGNFLRALRDLRGGDGP